MGGGTPGPPGRLLRRLGITGPASSGAQSPGTVKSDEVGFIKAPVCAGRRTALTALAQQRRVVGMRQHQIAMLAGITREALSHLETGKARPTLDTAAKLARVLGC